MSSTLQTEKVNQKELDQLILGIAHELNNPNAFVRMNITNLKKMFWLLKPCLDEYEKNHPEEKFGPYSLTDLRSKMNQQMEGILGATVRIIVIADRLKECSTESLEQRAPLSLLDVVQSSVQEHGFLFERCCELAVNCQEDEKAEMLGYRLQIEQALSILLTNACDAMVERFGLEEGRQGRLEICLSRQGNEAVLQVTDNGCGMDQKTLTKVFVPYFTTKPHGSGDGLGMSICQSVISRHDGSIDMQSTVGQGTTITLKFPLKEE